MENASKEESEMEAIMFNDWLDHNNMQCCTFCVDGVHLHIKEEECAENEDWPSGRWRVYNITRCDMSCAPKKTDLPEEFADLVRYFLSDSMPRYFPVDTISATFNPPLL